MYGRGVRSGRLGLTAIADDPSLPESLRTVSPDVVQHARWYIVPKDFLTH